MELRSKVEAALREHGPMDVKTMRKHVKCTWLAKLCSNLAKHHVIRKVGGGTRSGIYALPDQKYDGLASGGELGRKTPPQRKSEKATKPARVKPAAKDPYSDALQGLRTKRTALAVELEKVDRAIEAIGALTA